MSDDDFEDLIEATKMAANERCKDKRGKRHNYGSLGKTPRANLSRAVSASKKKEITLPKLHCLEKKQ